MIPARHWSMIRLAKNPHPIGVVHVTTLSRRILTVMRVPVALACTLGALAWATDGFRGLTSETIRARRVAEHAVQLPAVPLVDQTGHSFTFGGQETSGRPVLLIDFVYTRCQTVCSAMGSRFQQLQQEIVRQGLTDRVRLVSVSFDAANDTTPVIAQYARRMHADPETWRIARVADAAALPALLETFGIRVVPGPLGEFEHNAAFHVVNARGQLVRIVDLETNNVDLLRLAALYWTDKPSPTISWNG
jgi:protein SCO1/2